VSGRVQ